MGLRLSVMMMRVTAAPAEDVRREESMWWKGATYLPSRGAPPGDPLPHHTRPSPT